MMQSLLIWGLGAYAVKSSVGFPMHRQVLAGSTALIASVIMGAVVWVAMQFQPETMTAPVRLMMLVLIGVLTYAGALASLSPRFAKRALQAAIMLLQGRREEAIALAKGASMGKAD